MYNANTDRMVALSTTVGFAPVKNTAADAFTVWGAIDGEQFKRTFPSARASRAWRNMQRAVTEVRGMQSGEVDGCFR